MRIAMAMSIVLFLAVSCALAQSAALIGKGSFQSKFEPSFGVNPFQDTKSLQATVSPGAELVLFPSSRVGLGIEFLSGIKSKPVTDHYPIVTDQYSYVVGSNRVIVSEPGKEFAGYTQTRTTKAPYSLLGNAYLNLLKRGMARPFVVGGYGIAVTESAFVTQYFYDPVFQQRTGFKFNNLDHVINKRAHIVKGGVGLNIFPAGPLFLRLEGGYRNGGYAAFGGGLAFGERQK